MKISTKGRYALRMMIDLAEHQSEEYIAMKEAATRQEIALKDLERIVPQLVKAGLIEGVQGKGGGYRLTKKPEEYTVGEILRQTEGELAPVACLEEGAPRCERVEQCRTIKLWMGLDKVIHDYLESVTLADLMQ